MTALTKTENRVLSAMRQAQEHDLANEPGFEDIVVTRVQYAHKSIVRAVNHLTFGRRNCGDMEVYDALQKLVAKGLVEKNTITGMGGGFTTYVLAEQGQS